MTDEKDENAAALIKKAGHWIKRTRRFATNIQDQQVSFGVFCGILVQQRIKMMGKQKIL
jgi:hypothetical protein